jgi:hypothetical protein
MEQERARRVLRQFVMCPRAPDAPNAATESSMSVRFGCMDYARMMVHVSWTRAQRDRTQTRTERSAVLSLARTKVGFGATSVLSEVSYVPSGEWSDARRGDERGHAARAWADIG